MKYRTIIIDDHKLFNDGLSLILKESGKFQVIKQVFNSRTANYECTMLKPDLVLVDYNMPHMNGIEVVEQLKKLQSKMKIVIISMYAESTQIKKFKMLGVDGFLTKTIDGTDLVNILHNIMNGESFFTENRVSQPFGSDFLTKKDLLTKRETEVLKLIRNNNTTQQISELMNISQFTVETHRKNINKKLKFDSKIDFYKFLESL